MGCLGACCCVILAMCECIWNVVVNLLVLPTFDDTGSLDYTLHKVIYHPSASILVTASHFLTRNREAELKPITSLHFTFPSPIPRLSRSSFETVPRFHHFTTKGFTLHGFDSLPPTKETLYYLLFLYEI